MQIIKFMHLRAFWAVLALLFLSVSAYAGNMFVINSDPEGAKVYLNGLLICESTPAVVEVPGKQWNKTLIFQFVKEGYESKTVTLSYSKAEIKNQPVVKCSLKKIAKKEPKEDETGIRNGHKNDRVNRNKPGGTDIERSIIRWYFDSDPRGSRIFWRVISSCPNEVRNTNESYLSATPYEETRGFNIMGLTYENANNVTIEVKITKRGYEDQIKRFNVRQCLDQQEISGFYDLVPKEDYETPAAKKRKKKTVVEEEEEYEE